MAYIGREPQIGNYQVCDAISVVNGQAAYTMQVGSVNVSPESANHMIVSLNGVIQKPGSSFTISGSTITFSSNLATGDAIDFIYLLGNVLDLGVPSDATVTTAKIADDAVTLGKMASGTDGNIISYDASGNPVAIATGTSGHFLKSQGAGSQPVFAAAGGGKIGQVVSTNKTDTFSASVATEAFSSIVTGLTVNITPSASSSKILVFVNMNVGAAGEHGLAVKLFRDTTQIDLGDASSSRARLSKGRIFNYAGSDAEAPLSLNFLDSPSSTSQITYGVKIGHSSGSAKTLYVNRSDNDPDDLSYGRGTSTITVMEVLA